MAGSGYSWCGSLALLGVVVGLAHTPADAQTAAPDVDAAIRASLTELLSLATMGTITPADGPAKVARLGADYQVRLPLEGFSGPAEAIMHPLAGQAWDIMSLTLPSSGTFDASHGRRIEFAIGAQSIRARVDPGFTQTSSYTGNFGTVNMRTNQGEQTFGHYSIDGTLSAEHAGGLDLVSQGKVTDWHLTTHGGGGNVDSRVREVSSRLAVEGLNRGQAALMAAAARTWLAGDWPADPSERRQAVRALVDAAPGLLSRFRTEEMLAGIHFGLGPDSSGTINRLRLEISGDAADERVGMRLQVGFDELALSTLPADTAALLPHHFDLQLVVAGLQSASVIALLRAATEAGADPDALRDQVAALFGDPRASVRIDSVTFDCGPMQVAGSARNVALADGQVGAAVHVSAVGLDALMALGQRTQALRQFMPMLAIAKGKGRQAGDTIVWDFTSGL